MENVDSVHHVDVDNGNISREHKHILKKILMRDSLENNGAESENGIVRLISGDEFRSQTNIGSFSWTDNQNHNFQLPSYGLYLFSTTGNSTYKRIIAYINYINNNDNEITYAKYVNYYNKYWTIKLNQNNLTFGLWWGQISVNEGKTDDSEYSAYIVQLINY